MKVKPKQFKFTSLVVLISGLCTSCMVLSNHSNTDVSTYDDLATQKIEQEKAELTSLDVEQKSETELMIENQKQAEAKLSDLVGNLPLQFYSVVAKIYSDLEYTQIWQDQNAEKQFLREYAALVASGISKRSAQSLEFIDSIDEKNILLRDILLTDAFLDYLYYTDNVSSFAQSWLYSINKYKPMVLSDELISQWLIALRAGDNLSFINRISGKNNAYSETLAKLSNDITHSQKNVSELYKLAINLQRLRVIPNFDNGIFVNIPSYQLNYYRDGELILNSKVIVGRKDRRTPVMHSKLSNVVVNPPWNVPNSILTKDLVPKLANDPSYADRASLEIFDKSGKRISANEVDWGQYVNTRSAPFRIRQKAGDDSALGRFKFNMPSSDAIYLHDTPNKGLFNKKSRALSSGCVRVAKSDELASILLKEAGWSMSKKQNVLASKKTTSAPIQSDNPVYLYYVTAWVENGEFKTLPDIYGYDKVKKVPNYIDWDMIQKYL